MYDVLSVVKINTWGAGTAVIEDPHSTRVGACTLRTSTPYRLLFVKYTYQVS